MLTALYDGKCLICQSSCRTLRALDWLGRIEFIDLHQGETWRARYPDLDHQGLMGACHVFDQRGRLFPGFYAVRRMLKEVPLGFPLWLLLQLPGMDWLGERAYGWIARHRYRINRLLGVDLADCDDGTCEPLQ